MKTRGMPLAIIGIISAAVAITVLAPPAHAIDIELGPVRENTIKWLMKSRDLTRQQAEAYMRESEARNGHEIIDKLSLPDGAVMDFYTVDGRKPPGQQVTHEGCGMLMSPYSKWGKRFWKYWESQRGTQRYDNFMKAIGDAYDRGFFVQKMTPKELAELQRSTRSIPGTRSPVSIQYTVIATAMPWWDDRSPTAGNYFRQSSTVYNPPAPHFTAFAPGGRLSGYTMQGLNNPSWNATGPEGPHPQAEPLTYPLDFDFHNHWFDLMFNAANPNSVKNYFWENSHGKIAITGDGSNVVGWLRSNHVLDRVSAGGIGHSFAVQPGTPMIPDLSGAGPLSAGGAGDADMGMSWTTSRIGLLFRQPGTPTAISITPSDTSTPTVSSVNAVRPYADVAGSTRSDNRRWILEVNLSTATGPNPYTFQCTQNGVVHTIVMNLNATPTQGYNLLNVAGISATDVTLQTGDVIGNEDGIGAGRPGARLKSYCYYLHDHNGGDTTSNTGLVGSDAYQLMHIRTGSTIDDIAGTGESSSDRADRPIPFDHDVEDHNKFTGGYFHYPNTSNQGGHSIGGWISDVSRVIADEGITTSGTRIYIFPSGSGGSESGGGPGFIPSSALDIPEDAGLTLLGHELGHTYGAVDLYDTDFYYNSGRHLPPHMESYAMGPYSVMAHGVRFDAWHKIQGMLNGPWVNPVVVTDDILGALVPQIEHNLINPVIYKIPVWGGDPKEYFLIENRNENGASYFGDQSPPGMYIYHIDERFGQDYELTMAVIIEQADGLNELENTPVRTIGPWTAAPYTAAMRNGDPFPGSTDNRNFTQLTNPSSRSHGLTVGGVLQPGTAFDSFIRVANISDPGAMMTADIYVKPREVVCVGPPQPGGVDVAPSPPGAHQGDKDVPILLLKLDNDSVAPNLSTGDVILQRAKIDETGSSTLDTDIFRAKLYDDTDMDQTLDPSVDNVVATANVVGGVIVFEGSGGSSLGYRIPLDEQRNLIVAYDISPTAEINPTVTLGASLVTFDYMTPEIPGAVQERVRLGGTAQGASRFPVVSTNVFVIEDPDTLFVQPIDRSTRGPATAQRGATDVPMLSLDLSVDQDQVTIRDLKVKNGGTTTPGVTGNVSLAKLYDDVNGNGAVDGGDTLITTASFNGPTDDEEASFQNINYTVQYGTPRSLLITYDIAANATIGDGVSCDLPDNTYVTLEPNVALPPPLVQEQDIVEPFDPGGIKTIPETIIVINPDDIPMPPSGLVATDHPNDQGESIDLVWNRSDDDGLNDNDVLWYAIYRQGPAAYTTTDDGAPDGATMVDATLGGVNDQFAGDLVTIPSMGGETRRVAAYDAGTGTLTLETPFSAQVPSGTAYELWETIDLLASQGRPQYTYTDDGTRLNPPAGPLVGAPVTGEQYCYQVAARDGEFPEVPESVSNIDCAIAVDDKAPDAPSNCVAEDTERDRGDSNTVTWDASPDDGGGVGDVVSYNIYRDSILIDNIAATGAPNYTYDDGTATNETAETYYVTALDTSDNESAATNSDDATAYDNAARNVIVTDTTPDQGYSLTIDWERSWDDGMATAYARDDVDSYDVYRDDGGGPALLTNVVADNAGPYNYVDDGSGLLGAPQKGTQYCYTIVAKHTGGDGQPSDQACGVPVDNMAPQPPQPPFDAYDTPADQGHQVTVEWGLSPDDGGGANDVTGYIIYIDGAPGPTAPAGATSAVVDGTLVDGQQYCFQVTATDDDNESLPPVPADPGVCATPVDNTAPAAPTSLAGADTRRDGGGSVTLTFDASTDDGAGADDVDQYNVYRDGGLIGAVTADDSASYTYVDATAANDTPYTYEVRADDGENQSAAGAATVAGVEAYDNRAQNVAAADTPSDQGYSITVTWDKANDDGGVAPHFDDVESYNIYRANGGGPVLVGNVAADNAGPYTFVDDENAGLQPKPDNGTQYCYTITCVYTSAPPLPDEGPPTPDACATAVDNVPPEAPPTFTVTDNAPDQGGQILLQWDASPQDGDPIVDDVSAYYIWRAASPAVPDPLGPPDIIVAADDSPSYTYIDGGLTDGQEYCYLIAAYNDHDQSTTPTGPECATPADNIEPGAPLSLVAADVPADQGHAVQLTWNASPDDGAGADDVTEYHIRRDGAQIDVVAATDAATYQYTDNDPTLVNNQEYCYTVRAYDGANESADSDQACQAPIDNITPGAPSNLTADDTPGDQGHSVTLAWDASPDDPGGAQDVEEYWIYRDGVKVDTVSATGAATYQHNDTGLGKDTQYCYEVSAVDSINESPKTAQACATTVDNLPPGAPQNLIADDTPNDQGGSNTLTWDRSADDGIGADDVSLYRIYREDLGVLATKQATVIATVPADDSSAYQYDDQGLTDGETYRYSVTAFNGTGESPHSNEDDAIPADNIAPGAPQNFTAADVPDDEGFEVDLAWDASADDGAGAGDVIEYVIYQRLSPGGAYAEIARVAAIGAPNYAYRDTGLTNEQEYCYQVTAYDGANESSPSTEQCATPIDNLPPLPVPCNAMDTPNDTGESITVSWTAYAAPPDFDHYNVYRDTEQIQSVLGMTPITQIGSAATRTYADESVDSKVWYHYAVTAVDVSGNENPNVTSCGPVMALDNLAPVFQQTFGPGLYMLGLPAEPTQPLRANDVYLTPALVRWDGPTQNWDYFQADPADPEFDVIPGRATWAYYEVQRTVSYSGRGVAAGDDVDVPIYAGWTMIGNPRSEAGGGNSLVGVPMPWSTVEDIPDGIAADYGWIWNPGIGYQLVSAIGGAGSADSVPASYGFWISSTANGTLRMNSPLGGPSLGKSAQPSPQIEWSVPIVVTAGGLRDGCNYIGSASQPIAINNPPAPVDYVDAYFVSGGKRLAYDLRADTTAEQVWDFVVETDQANADVQVSLPDLSQAPKRCCVTLQDLDTGQVVRARTQSTYAYNSGPDAGIRRFRVTVTPVVAGALQIRGLAAAPQRGTTGIALQYEVTQPATVTCRIYNFAGRLVTEVERNRTVARGPVQTVWDGRSTAGTFAPTGAYLVRIEARTDTGERTSAVTQVIVSR